MMKKDEKLYKKNKKENKLKEQKIVNLKIQYY